MAMDGDSETEEEEIEKLEAEISEMARVVADYRATMPPQLIASLSAAIAALRPSVPPDLADVAQFGPSTDPSRAKGVPLMEEDQETVEKVQLLKQKISNDISAMPVLLKRMRDVISKLEKLNSRDLIIPPIYKKKRTS